MTPADERQALAIFGIPERVIARPASDAHGGSGQLSTGLGDFRTTGSTAATIPLPGCPQGKRVSPWSVPRSRDKEPGERHRRWVQKGQRGSVTAWSAIPTTPYSRWKHIIESGELPSPVAVRASSSLGLRQ